ncbi:polypeptide deformylase [Streptococcus infantarius subsp. infantarius]|uniref:peptide deformylase n=1 Tax=Streptococcus sp. TaxID=1306 RepID=UPI000EE0DDB2|nr:peptide deformylase [Streptococcus sp.]MCO4525217.1 polypeptide deformylase [Streptococcus infantarius subsp. infantarius]MCO4533176.1 polypeptide deformylase [Streptococcus infantarius subsp. infantarius]MCO4540639.1 polypeptide deformylase [Streptococcus infantarius subsp. infantarius]MCO4547209.1 polypeptide deformylase [Streptococcus infantarius subsp. infantarius]MCO4548885.1 polypeptide deformylase [Streptococcus infantarius subsp. infantarius]
MIKKIVKDTFFLAQKSQEATKEDLYLAQDLQDTLNANRDNCIGMAANMIGVKKRVIIVNMGLADLVMFNPVITNKSLPFDTEESCLSLLGSRPTRRYQKIDVTFMDKNWNKQSLTLTGLAAQICQHELDHLEGIII